MVDSELDALRAKRLAELQQQVGQQQSTGSGHNDRNSAEEQRQKQEDMRNTMLSSLLTQEARARLNTISLTKPEKNVIAFQFRHVERFYKNAHNPKCVYNSFKQRVRYNMREARARLNTISLTKPEKGRMVEDILIQNARRGAFGGGKVTEEQLIGLLEQVSKATEKTTKVNFDRRRAALDSDSD
ncbi:unnamed protein product [Rotaria sp. Silwood1]|nr:unnamed protein product [Rotaria sp. Silwood1]